MSLFTIDISAIISSPVGTTEDFRFEQEIPADTFEDLVCNGKLCVSIKLIHQEYGIECLLSDMAAIIDIPSESIENKTLEIAGVSREFHLKKKPTDTDDIQYINTHDDTVDLSQIIREELLISGL